MPQQPAWDRPEIRRASNETARAEVRKLLDDHGLRHLDVLTRGRHVVIYSEENGEKVSRVRFTRIDRGAYQLGMADHRGKWDITPFTGTLVELFTMVIGQFQWVLTEF